MNENDDYCRLTPVSDTQPLSLPIESMFQLTMGGSSELYIPNYDIKLGAVH